MQTYKSSAILKTMAKGQLLGKYATAAAAFLLISSISITFQLLSAFLVDRSSLFGIISYYIISFIISLLLGVLDAGVIYMSLKICCNEPISINDIFYGFNYHPNKIVYIQCILCGASLLSTIPGTIFMNLFTQTNQYIYFLLAAVFYVAGITAYCYISLVLSQAIFLLLDFSDRSPKELIRMSKVLMQGHKGRLFYIYISFIPLFLMGLFTCCIAYIWLVPYVRVTLANFYMDLMQNKKQESNI